MTTRGKRQQETLLSCEGIHPHLCTPPFLSCPSSRCPLFILGLLYRSAFLSRLLFIHVASLHQKTSILCQLPTSQHGCLGSHGDQRERRTTGVSLKCWARRLRKEQWGWGEEPGKYHLAQTSFNWEKKIRVNHLWSPWKLACNPSSHLLMKPQSPFINLLKNLFFWRFINHA